MLDSTTPGMPLSSFALERQARIERSRAINAAIRTVLRKLAAWLRALARPSARLVRSLAAEGRRRSAIRALHALDDRILSDIGVPRAEIEFAVRSGCRPRATQKPPVRQVSQDNVPANRRAA